MKRNRKSVLAEERRELMATGGGPPPPLPPPQPEIDNFVTHLEYEINNEHDSDDMLLSKNSQVSVVHVTQEAPSNCTSYVSASNVQLEEVESFSEDVTQNTLNLHRVSDISTVKQTATLTETKNKDKQKNHLNALTQVRLQVIDTEKEQLEELHKVRLEETNYKKKASRLVMLQEEEKLKQIMKSNTL